MAALQDEAGAGLLAQDAVPLSDEAGAVAPVPGPAGGGRVLHGTDFGPVALAVPAPQWEAARDEAGTAAGGWHYV